MSTAFFPTNMRRQSASGYSNHSTLENVPYVSWKARGTYRNPVGVTATHIRPLTNLDPGNVFPTGFGLPRPIKHWRKGTVIPAALPHQGGPDGEGGEGPEAALIRYNLNRATRSSLGSSLGGGAGGTGLIAQLQDMPGSVQFKENRDWDRGLGHGVADDDGPQENCLDCRGVSVVSSWMPVASLTETPQPNVTNPPLCCNQQRKALRRVHGANTNVKKNYFQTTDMYLYNRCQTFEQRQFNFQVRPARSALGDEEGVVVQGHAEGGPASCCDDASPAKPGAPLALDNFYVAQCNPNGVVEEGALLAALSGLVRELLDAQQVSEEEARQMLSPATTRATKVALLRAYGVPGFAGDGVDLTERGCARVYYKPNNPQFAQQGAVSSSTRTLKLDVVTVDTAAAARARTRTGTNVFKDKVATPQGCQAPYVSIGGRQRKRR